MGSEKVVYKGFPTPFIEKNMNTSVSIIVPVYNAEKFLSECVESILAQTYTNFELLLINDGSKDKSGDICDEYAAKDNRVSVRHIANGGVTAARKLGVEVAMGEWITFVDADDTIPADALERFSKLFSAETDIIIGQVNVDRVDVDESITIKDYRRRCIDGTIRVDACGKMIRRSIFSPTVLDLPKEIKVGEDMLMHVRLSFLTGKDVYFLPYPNHIYNYRSHEGQCSKTFKRTFDYEALFHEYLKKSIPENEWGNYFASTVKSRLNALRMVLMTYSLIFGMGKHPFYIELRNDIERSNYPVTWRDKLFLNAKNNVFRFVMITFVQLYTKVK